ncbi:glucosamine--fructose-6-phosphate aminotransferase (isomerizing) [Ruminiclostridium sufflavum DSM 19573]|uniref:Glucosamine--fructose-6-phosphate aminotransferase (Isomerizing) n=1 Tax=Ruminiclostridium sufflavum DSM 19573 TaxID=1121337 RepID=A0A318XP28_9FIRM|nr:SIS domain-containing protein [Ruminiclostridium sufflavum]PYG89890.1 glucosamine--fructose-6-phosphate aminotransferase (isomerizing) [Ruminiclostridium sufflavum DSM 19573]
MVNMWKEILEQPEVLKKTAETNAAVIEGLTADLKVRDISTVIIAARGTSDHAAVYAKYAIETLTGIPVSLAAPSVFTMYNKKINMKNCLVIGISQSGKAADAIEVVKAAAGQGAVTMSVTNFVDSPMAAASQYHLFCDAGIEKSVAATKTFTSTVFLLINFIARWAQKEELLKELEKTPDIMKDLFAQEDNIKETVQKYRFMKECFVLARGINYSIALEAALKIQETAYVRAKAFATSDFHHGPFAMIERDMPVIVYAPEGPSSKDVLEMVNKLKDNEADILIVSNNQGLLELGNSRIKIPENCSDYISPLFNAVAAQMFACKLSLLKGLNPDSPRGLNKVTITR